MSVSVKEMREFEARYIESGAATSDELMSRAAEELNRIYLKYKRDDSDAIILTGKGNNGGDGYALGCIFIKTNVPHILISVESPVTKDAVHYRAEYERLSKASNFTPIFDWFSPNISQIKSGGVIIDCMLGTGIKGEPRHPYDEAIKWVNDSGAFVISCDMPSGLTDCGIAKGAVKADITVAVGAEKDAYYLNDGKDYSGKIEFAPLGLPLIDTHKIVGADTVRKLFPLRRSNTHKGNYGTAVLIGCSDEYVGAGELAALSSINTMGLAALRSGAGLTRLIVPDRMLAQMWSKVRDCSLGLKSKLGGYAATAYGYGMGVGLFDADTLKYLIQDTGDTPLLIDADGLNILSANIDLLSNKPIDKPIIVTPHVKEMSRLTGLSVNEILSDPINAAESFAAEYGVTVLLKGTGTVITDGKEAYINSHGSSCLAKGGSGDVLSGIITALLARGADALSAGAAACYILGEASIIAEAQYGAYSTTPTDVARAVKKITLLS